MLPPATCRGQRAGWMKIKWCAAAAKKKKKKEKTQQKIIYETLVTKYVLLDIALCLRLQSIAVDLCVSSSLKCSYFYSTNICMLQVREWRAYLSKWAIRFIVYWNPYQTWRFFVGWLLKRKPSNFIPLASKNVLCRLLLFVITTRYLYYLLLLHAARGRQQKTS